MTFARTAACAIAAVTLAFSGPVLARPSARPAPAATHAATIANPALWRVADRDTTIYLFGTVHALPAGIEWFRGPIALAMNGSGELVSEIGEPNPGALQQSVLRYALLPKGQKLSDRFSAEELTRIDAALAKVGMKREMIEPVKPWFAALTISVAAMAKNGLQGGEGVEANLSKRAKERAIPHSGLETIDFQMTRFDSLGDDVQKRYLLEVADKLDEGPELLRAMIVAWQHGQAEELARLMNQDQSMPELAEPLLYSRNRNWADWIKARLDKPGKVFIAVGAGHLAGQGSVLQELAARGIRVKRIQ